MKAFILIFLIISIAIIAVLIKTNTDLRFEVEQQQQEIDASTNYIKVLTDELLKNEIVSHDHNEDQEVMSNSLAEYLEGTEAGSGKNFTGGHDKNMIFIPDHVPVVGEYVVSQKFKDGHRAVDLAASLGAQVVAAATGEIIDVKQDKYFGNMITIDHFNGYLTIYAHLAKILAEEGDIVKKGVNIGLVGNTGNSTGPHLHFEIMQNGTAVDPEELIDFSKL